MKLDEMIIKANADGKTYYCNRTDIEYSKLKGFTVYNEDENRRIYADVILTEGWKEKQLRHLTVSEAEKELDCVIDTPDISKLLRSPDYPPNNNKTIIVMFGKALEFSKGYYSGAWNYLRGSEWFPCKEIVFWIDPADLIKLLPKE